MTLGRTASGAIKIKTDGGTTRAVGCACCGGGGCDCGEVPPLPSYCWEVLRIPITPQFDTDKLSLYVEDVFDGKPVIVWALDFGGYFGAPYLSYWDLGLAPNFLPNYPNGTNVRTYVYSIPGYDLVLMGTDQEICSGLGANHICKVSC